MATIDKLPELRFITSVSGQTRAYSALSVPRDTMGMFKPFSISYHGMTTNGSVLGYEYFPLTSK